MFKQETSIIEVCLETASALGIEVSSLSTSSSLMRGASSACKHIRTEVRKSASSAELENSSDYRICFF